jgi:branched-chain amino acid transport system ATP-binding protein
MLEVNNLHVFYGQFEALNGLSFNVKEEEVVVLAGPNGHGKSTALKAIAGLCDIREGEILFHDTRIDNTSTIDIVKKGIILVPEGAHLFPEMTITENLLMGAFNPVAWKKRRENLEKVFKLFPNLRDIKNRLCGNLSGGERQCVAVGRGLMSSAKLIMLDEPTMGLAPLLAWNLSEKIKEIKESGMTIILVGENINYVEKLADRIYLINKGESILEGKANEVLEHDYFKEAYLGVG